MMAKDISQNYLITVIKDMTPSSDKPTVLSRGLHMRRYDFHEMSELVVWRTENVEPSDVELEVIENSLRVIYSPLFLARSTKPEQSGNNLAYRYYWPKKSDNLHLRVRVVQMGLGV